VAVALWLQGERDYRRGNFDSALVVLRRAVGEDSALAVAAVRGAQAASWKNRTPEAASLAAVALEHAELLPERQAAFTRGLADYLAGRADSAVEWLSEALARSPDWTEAHMVLGEVYHHLLPRAPAPLDSLAEVEFRAAARDTGFAPPQFHLAEIALRRGDIPQAERAAQRFARAGSGTEETRELDLMLACARGTRGAGTVDWATPAREVPGALLSAAKMLSVAGAFPECAEGAARALLAAGTLGDPRYGAYLLLENLQAARGRTGALLALTDSMAFAGYPFTATTATLVNALGDVPGFASRAEAGITGFRDQYGAQYEDSLDSGRLLLICAWYAKSGRLEDAGRIHHLLAARAAATRDPQAAVDASAAAAHLLLARGDSAGALQGFQQLVPVAIRDQLTWGYTESLPVERLLQSRMLLARGRYAEAIQVAEVFDHPSPVVYVRYLPASLTLRYQAARALGRRAEADRYRERLRALGFTEPT
jgi:tetratricopeptide (TPR) repeat protein